MSDFHGAGCRADTEVARRWANNVSSSSETGVADVSMAPSSHLETAVRSQFSDFLRSDSSFDAPACWIRAGVLDSRWRGGFAVADKEVARRWADVCRVGEVAGRLV